MNEPARIGLTKDANEYLDEMLESLNPAPSESGTSLIKFDLYRLAVALAIKHRDQPKTPPTNTDNAFRIGELDPDKALYIAAEASGLCVEGEAVYRCIERLADQGIRKFYEAYKANMGKLPWDQLFA